MKEKNEDEEKKSPPTQPEQTLDRKKEIGRKTNEEKKSPPTMKTEVTTQHDKTLDRKREDGSRMNEDKKSPPTSTTNTRTQQVKSNNMTNTDNNQPIPTKNATNHPKTTKGTETTTKSKLARDQLPTTNSILQFITKFNNHANKPPSLPNNQHLPINPNKPKPKYNQ